MPEENNGGDKPATKKYKVKTPIRIHANKIIKEGEIFKASEADPETAELLAVGAIEEA